MLSLWCRIKSIKICNLDSTCAYVILMYEDIATYVYNYREFEKEVGIAIKVRKQVAKQLEPVRNTELCNYNPLACYC